MSNPLRVALVEDNASLRQRLIEHFNYYPEVQLVYAAGSGEALIILLENQTPEQRPEVVLMDIELPGLDGIETTRRVVEIDPQVEVMMFTVFEDVEKLFASVQAGAAGYLLKDEPVQTIVTSLVELASGGAPMSPAMARKMLDHLRANPTLTVTNTTDGTGAPLTERERQILGLLVDGKNYHEVGDLLSISPQTVRSHIKKIYRKMEVHTRADAVRVAIGKGLTR